MEEHTEMLIRLEAVSTEERPQHLVEVRQELENFVYKGLLVSETEFRAAALKLLRSSGEERPGIEMIAVSTCDRPDLLKRSLVSYLDNARRHRRRVQFIIIDDSDSRSGAAVAASVSCTWEEGQRDVLYTDRRQRLRFARILAQRAGVPLRTVEFALLGDSAIGITVGSARNTHLLGSTGMLSIQVDDDTICVMRSPPESATGIALQSGVDPFESWFAMRGSPLKGDLIVADFIGMHEDILGRAVAGIVCDLAPAGGLSIAQLSDDTLRRMSNARASVLATFCGSTGDSGMERPWGRLHARRREVQRNWGSKEAFLRGFASRDVTRAPLTTTITDSPLCIGLNLGLDNRNLLPPFMPVLRGEDSVFMAVLRKCDPYSFSAAVPATIEHRPIGRPEYYTIAPNAGYLVFRASDLLRCLVNSFHVTDSATATGMRQLGEFLVEHANQSPATFRAMLQTAVVDTMALEVRHLQSLVVENPDAPEWWVDFIMQHMKCVKRSVIGSQLLRPCDLPGTDEDCTRRLQGLTREYGTLLRFWPDLVSASHALGAEYLFCKP